MREKTTLLGLAAALAMLGAIALPSARVPPPQAVPVSARAEEPNLERTPVPIALPNPHAVETPARDDLHRGAPSDARIESFHAAARTPLRLAIEGAVQPFLEPALRTIGRGPEQSDWAGGAVLDAVDRVLDRRAEIAVIAREPSSAERARGLGEIRIGELVVAVAVHPTNGLAGISRDQLRELLRGGVADWSDLGGRAGRIRLIAPAPGPTADLLARVAIAGDRFGRVDARDLVDSDAARLRMVAADPLALTVVPLGTALEAGARTLRIDGELPSLGAAHCGRYPFACPIVLGYADANNPRVSRFIADLARRTTRDVLSRTLSLE